MEVPCSRQEGAACLSVGLVPFTLTKQEQEETASGEAILVSRDQEQRQPR
jgi:hypothetical protein